MDKQCIASSDKIPLLCRGVGPHPHPRTRMHTYPSRVCTHRWFPFRDGLHPVLVRSMHITTCADVCKLVVVYI